MNETLKELGALVVECWVLGVDLGLSKFATSIPYTYPTSTPHLESPNINCLLLSNKTN